MKPSAHSQQGVFLLEALIGILVFSLGVLAMVALGTTAVSAQSDAEYRTAAAGLANDIAGRLSLQASRAQAATPAAALAALNASLAPFEHNLGGGNCNFTSNPSAEALVTDWVTRVMGDSSATPPVKPALPGVTATMLQIDTTTLQAFSGVSITICWQASTDRAVRSYTLVTYVN